MEVSKCHICGEKADGGLHGSGIVSPYSMSIVCEKHEEYHLVWQSEIIAKKLGFIEDYSDKMKTCSICEKKLSQTEIDKITQDQKLIVCEEHEEVKDWMQLYIAKRWFEYKENVQKSARVDCEASKANFFKWLKAKQDKEQSSNNNQLTEN